MTVVHGRRTLVGALLLVLAGAYAAASVLLWRSSTPAGLELPKIDVHDYFTAPELERTASYERVIRLDFLLSQAALVIVLGLYALRGPRLVRESAAGRIGTGMLLGMLGLAILWLVQLPFGLAELWWQRRHGISREGYFGWIVENWLGLGGEFLFICLAILIVMALAGVSRHRWWVLGGPAFVGLATLFAFLLPYLIPAVHPLRDPALASEARRLAIEEGIRPVPVEVQEVRTFTTAPNAEAAGLGPSRRVILWDTLLDGRFPRDEISVVLAHELGHVSRNHVLKSVVWYALFALPGAFLIARATRARGGVYEPRAIPLALFVLVVLQLFALPLQNVITRHLEAEADWEALEATRDPDAARGLFARFSTTSLAEPSPPMWAYLLMGTHPTLAQRISMANAWEMRERP